MSPMISKRNLALCDNLTCSPYSLSESLWRFFVRHVNSHDHWIFVIVASRVGWVGERKILTLEETANWWSSRSLTKISSCRSLRRYATLRIVMPTQVAAVKDWKLSYERSTSSPVLQEYNVRPGARFLKALKTIKTFRDHKALSKNREAYTNESSEHLCSY